MDDFLKFEVVDSEHPNRCCVPSFVSKTPIDSLSFNDDTASKDLRRSVGSNFLIVQNICRYLDRADLRTAFVVDALWNEAATGELRRRLAPAWFSYARSNGRSAGLQVSRNFVRTHAQFCVIACDVDRIRRKRNKVCVHESGKTAVRLTFSEYAVRHAVPAGVDYLLVRCSALGRRRELDETIRAVLLPHIPDVRVVPISCDVTDNPERVRAPIGRTDDIRCVFLLSLRYGRNRMDRFLRALFDGVEVPGNVALGGGLVKSAQFSPIDDDELTKDTDVSAIRCLAFVHKRGKPVNFSAHSTIINSHDEFADKLIEFKSNCTLRTHGVIFRMCCYAKQNKELEHDVIDSHFPNYAVFSLEVDGELGWDNTLETNTAPYSCIKQHANKRRKIIFPNVWHSWSTILILVSWGDVTKN